jgi:hypothetical protein
MDRLFRISGLYGRSKLNTRRGEVDYVRYTLERACAQQTAVWMPSTRSTAPRPPRGRRLSERTEGVLRLAASNPSLSAAAIAHQLGFKDSGPVRVILHRYRGRKSGMALLPAPANTQGATPIKHREASPTAMAA